MPEQVREQVFRKVEQRLQKEDHYHAWHYGLPDHSRLHHITEYVFYGSGPQGKFHSHPDFPEHWLFLEGDAIVHLGEEEVYVSSGDLIVTMPGAEHCITPLSDIRLICFGPLGE